MAVSANLGFLRHKKLLFVGVRTEISHRRPCLVTCSAAGDTVVIGLAADSGCGKSTFMRRLTSVFGGAAEPPKGGNPDSNTLISDTTTVICLDDYHSLDRSGRKEKGVTALDPRANDFDLMFRQVKALKEGKSVDKPIYNHVSGLLDPPEVIKAPKILVIEGLHPIHFKKNWQTRVKTWFNQPARKVRRRSERQKKAVKIFPRPTAGPLRPIVHGQTVKYNMKVRAGRGFSLEELKAAGIPKNLAPTIGIAVDHRRKNRSLEGLQVNVQRLKTYKAKLVVFPRRTKTFKSGDSTAEELANATQVQGPLFPIVGEKPTVELVKVTDAMKSFKAYGKLRVERTFARHVGARLKRAAEAEKEEKK